MMQVTLWIAISVAMVQSAPQQFLLLSPRAQYFLQPSRQQQQQPIIAPIEQLGRIDAGNQRIVLYYPNASNQRDRPVITFQRQDGSGYDIFQIINNWWTNQQTQQAQPGSTQSPPGTSSQSAQSTDAQPTPTPGIPGPESRPATLPPGIANPALDAGAVNQTPATPPIPDIPQIPQIPQVPQIPNLPNLPIPQIPNLPLPQAPNLPIPQLPQIPNLPIPQLPQVPNLPIPQLPQVPNLPIPQLPNLQQPQIPQLPNLQQPQAPNQPITQLPNLQQPNLPIPQLPQAPNLPIPQLPNLQQLQIPNLPIPQLPNLQQPQIPQLPNLQQPQIPNLPIPQLPNLQEPQAPNQPITQLPNLQQPQIPNLPIAQLPNIQGIQGIPTIPNDLSQLPTRPLTSATGEQIFVLSGQPQFFGNYDAFASPLNPVFSLPPTQNLIFGARATDNEIPRTPNDAMASPSEVSEMSFRMDPEAAMEEKAFVLDERGQFEEEKTEMPELEELRKEEMPELEELRREEMPELEELRREEAPEEPEDLARAEAADLESNPSVAQAAPEAVALAGVGGLASSGPLAMATSLGKGGLAFASPTATSVAGDFPEVKEEPERVE